MKRTTATSKELDSAIGSTEIALLIKQKRGLYRNYQQTYGLMLDARKKYISAQDGVLLEIGTGGGFLKELLPELITSDVIESDNAEMVINAQRLPFEDNSVSVIFAMHVLHHIPDIRAFLDEASRVLAPGGGIICVEPYWGPFASFLFKNFHEEPFDKKAAAWEFPSSGPMSGANQALSYLLLKRDKAVFEREYPQFSVMGRRTFNCLAYIASGGYRYKQYAPDALFPLIRFFDVLLSPLMRIFGLHHRFVLVKTDSSSSLAD